MSTIIQIKRSSGSSAPSTLKLGELAYTYGTGTQANLGDRLFVGEGGVDGQGNANNVTVIGGEYFTNQLDHAHGTLTATSALLVDSNKAIDEIFIGNNSTTGGTLKLNEGTSNGTNFIGIKSPNSVTTSTTFTLPDGDGSSGQFLKTDGSGNLSFETVVSTLSIAADSGSNDSVSTGETITFAGGTGIDTTVTNNQISIAIDSTVATLTDSQTLTNKTIDSANNTLTVDLAEATVTGTFAEFNSAVSDATLVDLDDTQTLTNKTISGSSNTLSNIANSSLTNSSITIGSDSVSLGATQTDLNGITSLDVDNITVDGNTISTTDANGDLILDPNGSGDVDVNNSKIINVSTPTADNDAANKAYVDGVVNGLDVKESVVAATTANLSATYNNGSGTLTAGSNGALSIDGVTPSQGDRILVKDQTTQTQNGIYTVTTVGDGSTAFVLTRAPDADSASELTGGTFFFVESGSNNADNGYVATHNGTPTFGTTNITFSQFSGAGQISAGDGLTKTGNQLDVQVDDSSIEISSDALQVKALGITDSMLAGSISASKLAGSIPNTKLSNSAISFTDESSTVGSVSLGGTLEFLTGEGIDTTASGSTITIAAELATTSNKGVASFSSDNFTVTSGAVSVTAVDGGTF